MEVTNENFSKAYSILENEIQNADFISIDGEFSGLSTIRSKAPGYDTLEEMYEKTRFGSGKMLMLQYGISLFTWKDKENHYEAIPFSFYIFPRPYKKYGNDVVFTSQSSSLDFLSNNGFDFNKVICKGISFMTPCAEEKARESIEREMEFFIEKEKSKTTKPPSPKIEGESKVFIPKDQREFIDTICEAVKSFIENQSQDSLDLPNSTPFQRKLIYERLEELYPLGLYLESGTNEENQKFVRCHKILAGYKKNIEEKHKRELKMLEDNVGFSKVMKLVSNSRKPLVGHNMFLDLFLTMTNFFGELPSTFAEFKETVAKLFPVIYDTKVIASMPPVSHVLTGTSLEALVNAIEDGHTPNPSVITSDVIREEDGFAKKYHDAGYDALSTGRIFISLMKHVSSLLGQSSNHLDLSSDSLRRYVNCVHIMGIRDIDSANLCKEDTIPARHNVFYIRFPISWKPQNIKELFSPYCSLKYPINWINEESVFVTINEEDRYDAIFKNLVMSSSNKGIRVLPYKYYINNKDPREKEEQSNEEVPCKWKRVLRVSNVLKVLKVTKSFKFFKF